MHSRWGEFAQSSTFSRRSTTSRQPNPSSCAFTTPLIPFDRFTFGLQAWGHLYCIEGTRVEKAPGIHIIKGQYPEPTVDRDEVIGESASHWTVANCRPLIRSDISKEMCFEHDERRVAEGMLSDLIVPIVVDDQIVGTFNFTSRAPGVYTKEHLETAESVADGIATVARAFGTHLSRVYLEEQVAIWTEELGEANRQLKEEISQRTRAE